MNKMLFCAGIFSASLALPAFGVEITIDDVTGNWTSVDGGTGLTGVGTNEIRWGTPSNEFDEKSGYLFEGAAPAAFNVNVDEEFTLGTFNHLNYVIKSGGGINGAVLSLQLALTITDAPFGESFNDLLSFNFFHNETPNDGEGCCNDIVSFEGLTTSDTFVVNGTAYTLDLRGFSVDGGLVMDEFSTVENETNLAELRGVFTAVRVPEPGTLALLGLGLAGLVASRRRKS